MRTMLLRNFVLVGCGALGLLLSAPPAVAQWSPRVGIGYVVNAPNQYVGLSGHVLTRYMGGLGLYVDAKTTRPTVTDDEKFEEEWTAQFVDDNFGDIPFGDESEYWSINAAVMRPTTPELILYLGGGYTERNVYVEYIDDQGERGVAGVYWVEDTDEAASGLNVIAGAFFRIARSVSLQFGVEAQPRGVTVGASYAIPIAR